MKTIDFYNETNLNIILKSLSTKKYLTHLILVNFFQQKIDSKYLIDIIKSNKYLYHLQINKTEIENSQDINKQTDTIIQDSPQSANYGVNVVDQSSHNDLKSVFQKFKIPLLSDDLTEQRLVELLFTPLFILFKIILC